MDDFPAGDWGPDMWPDASGVALPNGPQVQAKDVLTQTTVADGPDGWSKLFQNLLTTTAQYAIQKDAVNNQLVQQRAANGTPVYVPAPTTTNPMAYVIIGGAVLVAIALVAAHGKG